MLGQDKRRKRLGLKSDNKIFQFYHELLAIIVIAISAFLFLSFFSYNPTDQSWFYFSTSPKPILNWTGVVGANIAASFFYLFGSVAYVFIGLLIFLAILFFQRKDPAKHWPKLIGFVLSILSLTTFCRMYNLDFTKSFAGGWLGNALYKFINYFVGFWGTNIFVFSLFVISIILLFNISIFSITIFVSKVLWSSIKLFAKYLLKLLIKVAKFLFKNIKEMFIALGLAIYNFVKKLFIKLFSWIKSKFTKKTGGNNSEQDSVFTWKKRGSVKESKKQDDVWQSLQSFCDDVGENDKIINTFECASTMLRSVRTTGEFNESRNIEFGKYKLLFLQNTACGKNFLTSDFISKLSGILEEQEREKNFVPKIEYDLPNLDMFKHQDTDSDMDHKKLLEEACIKRGEKLEEKLRHFGIKGKVTAIRPGPVITLFEYKPEIDSKISKIVSLEDDLAMALTAISIRIVAPIPGKSVVGFEISNHTRENVYLSDVLLSDEFKEFRGKLPLNLGVDLVGKPVIEDLVKMPHLLVAGSTGSGKSVGLNAMLAGLLCKLRPDQLKIILIDPKRLEFSPYADIPHLLFPIITNPRKAAPVLKWLVQEMEDRYDKMAQVGVRNVTEYQKYTKKYPNDEYKKMPFIVLMIDELADLMMVAGKDVETQIARIAQMARAAGIHMIVATQRPSVDVVTGLIKVNFPSRVAYRVSSKIDSRTIIDAGGAEKLLGMGDLLYMNSGSSDLQRIHGAYISQSEIEDLTTHLCRQAQPEYLDLNEALRRVNQAELSQFEDELYPQVIEFVQTREEISISMLQRYYKIGFNRSAKIIERLELDGLIAPAQGSKPRKVLRS